jgi:hypothetical protein
MSSPEGLSRELDTEGGRAAFLFGAQQASGAENLEYVSHGMVKLGSLSALRWVYTSTERTPDGPIDLRSVQYIVLNPSSGLLAVMTCFTTHSAEPDALSSCDAALGSFAFSSTAPKPGRR